jgi:hypothetical protein
MNIRKLVIINIAAVGIAIQPLGAASSLPQATVAADSAPAVEFKSLRFSS